MNNLFMWDYQGQTEFGWKHSERTSASLYVASDSSVSPIRDISQVTNFRPAKVVDEDDAVISGVKADDLDFILEKAVRALPEDSKTQDQLASVRVRLQGVTPPITKTYLTTEQFIKVWKSLDESKQKELHAARFAAQFTIRSATWSAARDAARGAAQFTNAYAIRSAARSAALGVDWYAIGGAVWYADLAIFVRDKITPDQFNILVQPWTSCGLSLYAEDWEEVLNPKVVEPKNFGAIVEASVKELFSRRKWLLVGNYPNTLESMWRSADGKCRNWHSLINPTIISEGVE